MPYRLLKRGGIGEIGVRAQSSRRDEMGETRGDPRRLMGRLVAAVAVSDLAYRLFVRGPLRRALGIEVKHA
jgi:hypothetical protein